MKWIKYKLFQSIAEDGNPILFDARISWSEDNEEIAKAEAYNGEYEIFDDGQPGPEQPEPETEPSVWDELDAAYTEGVDSI